MVSPPRTSGSCCWEGRGIHPSRAGSGAASCSIRGISLSLSLSPAPLLCVSACAHKDNKIPAQLLTCTKECNILREHTCSSPFIVSSPLKMLIIYKQIFWRKVSTWTSRQERPRARRHFRQQRRTRVVQMRCVMSKNVFALLRIHFCTS